MSQVSFSSKLLFDTVQAALTGDRNLFDGSLASSVGANLPGPSKEDIETSLETRQALDLPAVSSFTTAGVGATGSRRQVLGLLAGQAGLESTFEEDLVAVDTTKIPAPTPVARFLEESGAQASDSFQNTTSVLKRSGVAYTAATLHLLEGDPIHVADDITAIQRIVQNAFTYVERMLSR